MATVGFSYSLAIFIELRCYDGCLNQILIAFGEKCRQNCHHDMAYHGTDDTKESRMRRVRFEDKLNSVIHDDQFRCDLTYE